MDNIIKDMNIGVWWSLIILVVLYCIKEIIRYIVDGLKNSKQIKSEMQYKYAEKLLDQKIPIYVEHYTYLKQAIGVFLHIISNYHEFEKWDDNVYTNLENDKQFDLKDKGKVYRKEIGYRFCENLNHYVAMFEDLKLKSMNVFSLNQLFVNDELISDSLEINKEIDEKLKLLMNIVKKLEQKNDLTEEEFKNYYENQFKPLKYETFINDIEYYLEKVKIEFYNEYNVELQNDYVKGKKRA